MKHADFVHLHVHTQYSLLDGAIKLDDLMAQAKEFKMPALAITDHGNMFGAVEFYQKCMASGIKPLIGCEVYVAPQDRRKKEPIRGLPDAGYHLILLVRNQSGYKNLMRLSSIGYLEGFYHKPRIDREVLRQHTEGLLALSSCLRGEIPSLLLEGKYNKARDVAEEYKDTFGEGNFFLEIQNHQIEEEKKVIPLLAKLAEEANLGLVATNDCHYLKKEHAPAHDALLCIQTGKKITDTDRLKFANDQMYFKSPEEMKKLFADFPSAVENTLRIAEACNLDLEFGKTHLPEFPPPPGFDDLDSYLEFLAKKGLAQRYSKVTPGLEERLEYELKVIKQMGFAGYFLIVKDFIDYARNKSIRVGPGRGSVGGSLVAYCLGITNLDPIKYGLLFERFLNPERISLPDIDIDFSDRERDKIIRYVINKYGENNVAQIITFGTMAARAVIRDVGRVLDIPYSEVDRIAKMIPWVPDMTLRRAQEQRGDLRTLVKSDPRIEKLMSYSEILEGLCRHASTHAAGVVIAPKALNEYVPLYKGSKGEITTQYDMKGIEEIGLLKMDFLGLRTLTVIDDTLKMLREDKNIISDIDSVPLDDKKTFQLFSKGLTVGIFQFESSGMREYLSKLKPESLDELTAMNALYRPGPLDSKMTDEYIDRKRGLKKIVYEHPLLEPVLKETYGVIVFQEQVLKIASDLAGYTLGKADILRKAMGKKKAKLMVQQREEFKKGAKAKGIKHPVADKIFDLMATFGRYGFNKAHSAGYAYLAYQTAYLKAHYPVQFMAASMSSEIGNTDRIVVLMEECKRMGIEVLPPDVNESGGRFKVVENKIRFGLEAVKNVGHGAIQAIIIAREKLGKFKSLLQFCAEVDLGAVNKRVIESLIQSGAFDSVSKHRAQLMACLDVAANYGQALQEDKKRGQTSLFDLAGEIKTTPVPKMADVPEWPISEILSKEKEMLGFYVSGHPLTRYEEELKIFVTRDTQTIEDAKDGEELYIGGVITQVKTKIDRKKKQMAFATLEDFVGRVEVVIFSDCYEKNRRFIRADSMVLARGRASTREGEKAKLVASDIISLSKAYQKMKPPMHIQLVSSGTRKEILSLHPGKSQVFLHVRTDDEELKMRLKNMEVEISRDLLAKLKSLCGDKNVYLNRS
ncbi:MAG: DNA polymerase III subunit alpha [candidate division Zixibacteria bacterium SM23_73_3]|nr:MAG: DNA polymerase III subunit alpha [candidate division Zixibacteria bacterium SM23_73_3]